MKVWRVQADRDEYIVISMASSDSTVGDRLTAAERDVLEALIRGCSNLEIARERGRSPRTIANQVSSIFRKFQVVSRAELMVKVVPNLLGGLAPIRNPPRRSDR